MFADHPSTSPSASIAEQRVSNLVGDRLCIQCGYNLTGQPVLREPHYQMLIVRCPECATVASMQEYPLLGRWANRWAAALAAAGFLLLVALWIGNGAAIFGMSVGSAEISSQRYSNFLYEKFTQWQQQQTGSASAGSGIGIGGGGSMVTTGPGQVIIVSGGTADFPTWWQQQDTAALLAQAGGLWRALSWEFLYLSVFLALLSFCMGCFWAVVMLGRGRPTLLLWGMMVMLVACLFSLIPLAEWLLREPTWYWSAAGSQVGATVMLASLAWAACWLGFGLMVGRSAVRGLLRLLLPPRLCSSLGLLWTADGLKPPAVVSRFRRA